MNPSFARFPIAIVLIGLACGIGCGPASEPTDSCWSVEDETVTLEQPSPARFTSELVELGEPLPLPKVTARVTTIERLVAPSYPALPGRVAEVVARVGDRVNEGDQLIRVATGDLTLLQSEAEAAQLNVETKQATIAKLEQMVEMRLAPEHELTLARAELAEARLAAKTAKSRLRSLSVGRAGNSSFWVLANRSGTVVQLGAVLGQQVRPEQDTPVATVADLDEVMVIADVTQHEAARLTLGGAARVSIPGSTDAPLDGTIELVSDIVDPERQTVPIRVRVANSERRLRPNAYVDVEFVVSASAPVIRVPAGAVVRDGSKTVVFIDLGDQRYRAREVEVGRRSQSEVEIVGGLAAGETIVARNALLLLNAIELQG
jgi:cobalt-zinc-cadmium efflux system membrane fusion protein